MARPNRMTPRYASLLRYFTVRKVLDYFTSLPEGVLGSLSTVLNHG